jgi:capsular polysaccharide biosynthesis protein
MKQVSPNRSFAWSEKVYGWLLRAYPPAHRQEYGACMAQLFRDQCRNAWDESGGWGLVGLWLRVLPDLVKTSIIERLAALNERKSMTDKMAALIQSRTVFLKVFATVFLIVVLLSVLVTFLLPESYASTARIKVEADQSSVSYDPYFIQTQFEIMQSELVLTPVIEKLNLNVQWGRRYFAGQTLKTQESLKILKPRIILAPVRGTKLIAITVYSEDRKEAAQIANAITESYKNYRMELQAELVAKKVAALPAGPEKQAAELEAQKPKQMLVQITDQAEPGRAPVAPNKPLNITLGVVFGILAATVIGGIAVLVASRMNKRKQKQSAAQ